jgi:hypothetical protein
MLPIKIPQSSSGFLINQERSSVHQTPVTGKILISFINPATLTPIIKSISIESRGIWVKHVRVKRIQRIIDSLRKTLGVVLGMVNS